MRTPDLRELFPAHRVTTAPEHVKGTRILPEDLELRGHFAPEDAGPVLGLLRCYLRRRAPAGDGSAT